MKTKIHRRRWKRGLVWEIKRRVIKIIVIVIKLAYYLTINEFSSINLSNSTCVIRIVITIIKRHSISKFINFASVKFKIIIII